MMIPISFSVILVGLIIAADVVTTYPQAPSSSGDGVFNFQLHKSKDEFKESTSLFNPVAKNSPKSPKSEPLVPQARSFNHGQQYQSGRYHHTGQVQPQQRQAFNQQGFPVKTANIPPPPPSVDLLPPEFSPQK